MTDTKALIAEARELAAKTISNHPITAARLLRRLAAALEEAQVPEGWRVTELTREDGARVWVDDETEDVDWGCVRSNETALSTKWGHPTASAAMAALEDATKAAGDGGDG